MDISSFIQWFINQVMTIFTYIWNTLDNITIYGNVTLLDFIITLTIITIFIEIILALPTTASKISGKIERKVKNDRKQ